MISFQNKLIAEIGADKEGQNHRYNDDLMHITILRYLVQRLDFDRHLEDALKELAVDP
jgi:hypothetical protein